MTLPFEFIVREGPERGQRIPLPAERFSIGAAESCALRFPANMVRDVHAEVAREEGGSFEVEDRTGASLVWVDGQVVKKAPLYSGSVVRLGRVELLFVSLEDTAAFEPTIDRPPNASGSGVQQAAGMRFNSSPSNDNGLAALRATPLGRPVEPGPSSPLESSPSSPSGRFNTGDVIEGRYRVTSRIAAGGMGEVYKVEHVELGKPLAMKVMLPGLNADQEFINRFKIEAVAASRIGHQNIIDISDFGRTGDGRFFFVMEFLDGMTLSSLVHRQGQQSPGRAVSLVLQVARALAAAHELHIVHRDLKPDNVMVMQRPGNPDLVKVLDFGVARVQVDNESIGQTAAGIVVGTPQYMSPEQAKAIVVDVRSDIYSLGLILHELMTGKPAFTGETPPIVMVKQVTEPPPPLPDWVPEDLKDLVFDMLEKDPADRPQQMKEVVQTLDGLHRTLKTNDFQLPSSTAPTKEHGRTPTPAPPRSGKRAAPTPARGPTPTRIPSGGRGSPASVSGKNAPLVVERLEDPEKNSATLARAEAPVFEAESSNPALDVLPRASRAPLFIGAALVAVLVAGGAFVLSPSFTTVEPVVQVIQPEPLDPVKPPVVEPPAAPATLPLRIESVPPNAEVLVGGVLLGNTPLTLERKAGDIVEVQVVMTGFQPATRKLQWSAGLASVSLTLEPVRVAPKPRVEPRTDVVPSKNSRPPPALKPPPDDLKPLSF
ncbi:MAG: protein kinase [Myxococcales bacterium]|nr:protein kinase [Myxococcales bacterium]